MALKAMHNLLLDLFIPWQTLSSLLTPFWPYQGFFSLQSSAHLGPSFRIELSCLIVWTPPICYNEPRCYLLYDTLTTVNHSGISLLSNPLWSPRTYLLTWISTPVGTVYTYHLRMIYCVWVTCVLHSRVKIHYLLNEQISTWRKLAFSNCWCIKGLGTHMYFDYLWVCGANITCLLREALGLKRNSDVDDEDDDEGDKNDYHFHSLSTFSVLVPHIHDLLLMLIINMMDYFFNICTQFYNYCSIKPCRALTLYTFRYIWNTS